MLYAAGATWFAQSQSGWRPPLRRTALALVLGALAFDAGLAAYFNLPLFAPGTERFASVLKVKGDFAEEFLWPELVGEVARIRDTLPPPEQSRLGILAANYGEAGAVNLYGPAHRLPPAISGTNSFWAKGYGDPPPEILIVLGFSPEFREQYFDHCELAGHIPNPYGIVNEESRDNPDIYLCRGLKPSWPDFWKDRQRFGSLLPLERMLKA